MTASLNLRGIRLVTDDSAHLAAVIVPAGPARRRRQPIGITADLVRELLEERHPDLAGLAIREVAGGWGNQMWPLGDELAVRMQRMDPTPELQLKERRWLPVLPGRHLIASWRAFETPFFCGARSRCRVHGCGISSTRPASR